MLLGQGVDAGEHWPAQSSSVAHGPGSFSSLWSAILSARAAKGAAWRLSLAINSPSISLFPATRTLREKSLVGDLLEKKQSLLNRGLPLKTLPAHPGLAFPLQLVDADRFAAWGQASSSLQLWNRRVRRKTAYAHPCGD
jgi:hypothetical protein